MSFYGKETQRYMRDDHRGQVLLKAHLEAAQWKSEAWALADSLAWALTAFNSVTASEEFNRATASEEDAISDLDAAEYTLAQNRLTRVRKAINEQAAA